MKNLLRYIRKYETKSSLIYIIVATLISTAVALTVFIIRTASAESDTPTFHFSLSATIPFFIIMFFFGINFTVRLYRVHMQFGVSRKSGLKILLGYSILFAVISCLLSLAIEALFSVLLQNRVFDYQLTNIAREIGLISSVTGFTDILIGVFLNVCICCAILFMGMQFVVLGYILPPKVTASIGITIYIFVMLGISLLEEPISKIYHALGKEAFTLTVVGGFLLIELTVIILCYRRINYTEKQLVT